MESFGQVRDRIRAKNIRTH